MSASHQDQEFIEEISADEIEVISSNKGKKSHQPRVQKISADDSYRPENNEEDPLSNILKNIEELKKIRFFGPVALLCSILSFMFLPLYLGVTALVFGVLDLVKGSRFTHKISIFALILAVLSLLNLWT